MKKLMLAALAVAAVPAVAQAQDTAPDGTKAFGFEPYVGVLGGYHSFDRDSEFGTVGTRGKMNSPLVSGIAGANLPLGPAFIGVEGNVAKGISKDIDWEYGVRGRIGARAGSTGMIYVSGGYQWVNGKGNRGYPDRSDWMWGAGVEVGPGDIGLSGLSMPAGARLRLQVDTYDFDSIRPMAGIVFHF